MTKTQFPTGWDEARVKAVIADLERMTDEELAAEDDAVLDRESGRTIMGIPAELVPAVREMIAQHDSRRADAAVGP